MEKDWLTEQLTNGEAAWIKRWAAGESLLAFRQRKGMTRNQVLAAEADESPYEGKPIKLTWPKRLRLARRRAALGRAFIAKSLGVTVMTLHNWELEGDRRLIRFWERRGGS